jgi:cytochrome P450
MHRSPQYWADPQAFNPSRFLDPSQNTASAFLPFEKGPRNCIGQQLALTEAKVIMLLTLRFFDFEPRFDEVGPRIDGWGGRAYQELKLTAKPKDGIPMGVKLRGKH